MAKITTLVAFGNNNDQFTQGGLLKDADGNLIGSTLGGGTGNNSTVFEIAKTATGYAKTATILASFNGTNGAGVHGNRGSCPVIARSEATKQSSLSSRPLDCFVEPVIGRRFAPTRWLAMTAERNCRI